MSENSEGQDQPLVPEPAPYREPDNEVDPSVDTGEHPVTPEREE